MFVGIGVLGISVFTNGGAVCGNEVVGKGVSTDGGAVCVGIFVFDVHLADPKLSQRQVPLIHSEHDLFAKRPLKFRDPSTLHKLPIKSCEFCTGTAGILIEGVGTNVTTACGIEVVGEGVLVGGITVGVGGVRVGVAVGEVFRL